MLAYALMTYIHLEIVITGDGDSYVPITKLFLSTDGKKGQVLFGTTPKW